MTSLNLAMQVMFLAWIALVVFTIRRTIASGSVGLPAALLLTMSFLYGGCFVYAVPGYTHLRYDALPALLRYQFSELLIVQATFASLLAVAGFAIGCGVFRRRDFSRRDGRDQVGSEILAVRGGSLRIRFLSVILLAGIASYTLSYADVNFPLSRALLEAGRNALLVAVALGAFLAHQRGKSMMPWLLLAALIPIYYFALFAFLSYGFLFGATLFAFWMAVLRKRGRWKGGKAFVFNFLIIYLLLTAFTAWMSYRDEFREVIWEGEDTPLSDVLVRSIKGTELFSPFNDRSLDLINLRLNLNIFIGRMIQHHSAYPELSENGATLYTLPLVIVPRFLWPGKPQRGGSSFMEEHTGMVLSDAATFGTGTVFEFYINFGFLGVFLGFIFVGWLIRTIDRNAARHLQVGRHMDFARLYAVGIVAIDPLLRPFFIVNGAVFAWLLFTALKYGFLEFSKLANSSKQSSTVL